MRPRFSLLLVLLLALTLTACAAISQHQQEKKRTTALDDFMYALRWQRYPEAAQFLANEHRQPFIDQFEVVSKDLTVTDVRLKRAQPRDGGRSVDVVLELDYQLLPSASLKTLRIEQVWDYAEIADADGNSYRITTAFPQFPEVAARGEGRKKGTLPP